MGVTTTYPSHLAAAKIVTGGTVYRKRPGLKGFKAFYVDDDSFEVTNALEDARYRGRGFYLVGLLDEVWKVGSFEKISRSYVLDDGREDADAEIDEQMLVRKSATQEDFRQVATPIRYRNDVCATVLAVRAPDASASVAHEFGDDETALSFNAPTDSEGNPIDHGRGDMLVCGISSTPRETIAGLENGNISPSSIYVVNGAVFERTYEPVEAR